MSIRGKILAFASAAILSSMINASDINADPRKELGVSGQKSPITFSDAKDDKIPQPRIRLEHERVLGSESALSPALDSGSYPRRADIGSFGQPKKSKDLFGRIQANSSRMLFMLKDQFEFDDYFCRGDGLCRYNVRRYYGDLAKSIVLNETADELTREIEFAKMLKSYYLEVKAKLSFEYDFDRGYMPPRHLGGVEEQMIGPDKQISYEAEKDKAYVEKKERNYVKSGLVLSVKGGKIFLGAEVNAVVLGNYVSFEKGLVKKDFIVKADHPLKGSFFDSLSLEYVVKEPVEAYDQYGVYHDDLTASGELVVMKLVKKF